MDNSVIDEEAKAHLAEIERVATLTNTMKEDVSKAEEIYPTDHRLIINFRGDTIPAGVISLQNETKEFALIITLKAYGKDNNHLIFQIPNNGGISFQIEANKLTSGYVSEMKQWADDETVITVEFLGAGAKEILTSSTFFKYEDQTS